MSDRGGASLGTAEGRITVDASQAIGEINRTGAALDGLGAKTAIGQSIDTFNQSVIGLAVGMQHLGRVGVGLGTAIAAPFITGVKVASDFEQGMANVNAVTDATGEQLVQLGDLAKQLGADTTVTATEAAAGMEALGKAGIPIEDILNGAAEAAVHLAEAGGTGITQSAELIAAGLSAYSLAGEEATHVADLFAGAANSSLASISDLGQGFAQVGGVASALGIPLEELVTQLAIMTDMGLSGSDAATSIKTALTHMVAPIGEGAKEMARLGISFQDAQGEFIGIHESAQLLIDTFDALGMSEADQVESIKKIAGQDGFRALLFAMQEVREEGEAGTKGWDDYFRAVTEVGAAQRLAEERMDSTQGALERLRGAVETLMIGMGEGVNIGIRPIIEGLAEFVGMLADIPQPILNLITILGAGVGVLTAFGGAFLLVGGYVLEAYARFQAAGVSLNLLIGLFARVAAAATLAGAAIALAALAIQNNWLGAADAIRAVGDAIAQFGGDIEKGRKAAANSGRDMNALEESIYGVGSALSKSGIPAVRNFGRFLITNVVEGLFQARQVFAEATRRGLSPFIAGLKAASKFVDVFTGIAPSDLAQNLDRAADTLRYMGNIFGFINEQLREQGFSGLASTLGALGVAIESTFGRNIISDFLFEASDAVESFTQTLTAAIEQGFNPLTAVLAALSAGARSLGLDRVADELRRAAEASNQFAFDFGQAFSTEQERRLSGLAAGIAAFGTALATVTGIDITGFTTNLANGLDALVASFRNLTAQGFNPLEAALLSLETAFEQMTGIDITPFFDSLGLSLAGIRDSLSTGVLDGISRLGDLLGGVADAVLRGDWSGALAEVQGFITDVQTQLRTLVDEIGTIDVGQVVVDIAGFVIQSAQTIGDAINGFIFGNTGGAPSPGLGGVAGQSGGLAGAVDIGTVALNIAGWVINAAQSIGDAINAFVQSGGQVGGSVPQPGLGGHGTGRGGINLGTIAVTIGGWLVSAAQSLGEAIQQQLIGFAGTNAPAGLGGTPGQGGVNIEQMKVNILSWAQGTWASIGELAGQIETFIRDQLTSAAIAIDNFTGWSLSLGLPGGDAAGPASQIAGIGGGGGFDLSTFIRDELTAAAISVEDFTGWTLTLGEPEVIFDNVDAVLDAITAPLQSIAVSPEFVTQAAEIGKDLGTKLGQALSDAIEEAVTSVVSGGGGGVSGPASQISGIDSISLNLGHALAGFGDAFYNAFINEVGPQLKAQVPRLTSWLAAELRKTALDIFSAPIAGLDPGQQAAIQDAVRTIFAQNEGQLIHDIQQELTPGQMQQQLADASQGYTDSIGQGIGAGLDAGIQPMQQHIDNGLLGVIDAAGEALRAPFVPLWENIAGAGAAELETDLSTATAQAISPPINNGIGRGLQDAADAVDVSGPASDAARTMSENVDSVLSTSLEGMTLEDFSQQIGAKMSEAILQGMTQFGSTAGAEARGALGATSIGTVIGQELASSISEADFTAVGTAISSKISEALSTGLSAGDQAAPEAGAAAGNIGSAIANSIGSQIGQADFTAVGSAIQAKISAAIMAGTAEGGAQGEGAVAGAAGGIGSAIALDLASQIGVADFTAVGAAIQTKIAEAVSQGTTAGPAAQIAGVGGGGGSIGSTIAASIASDIAGADWSAAGNAIVTGISSSLGQATGQIQAALGAVIQAAVASGSQVAQTATQIGTAMTTAIGAGIGQGTGTITAAAAAAVQAGISAGTPVAAGANAVGTAFTTAVGAGIGQGTGTVTSAVSAMVQTAISGGSSAAAGANAVGTAFTTAVGSGIGQGTGTITSAVGAMVQVAIDAGVAAAAGASAIGAAISSGAASGVIVTALNGVVAEMVANGIAAGMAAAGAASPSRVMRQLGQWMSEGAALGVADKAPEFTKQIRRMLDDGIDAMRDAKGLANEIELLGETLSSGGDIHPFSDNLAEIGGSIESSAKSIQGHLRDLMKTVRDQLREGASSIGSESSKVGSAISSGLGGGGGFRKQKRQNLRGLDDVRKALFGDLEAMDADVTRLNQLADAAGQAFGTHDLESQIRGFAEAAEKERQNAIQAAADLLFASEAAIRAGGKRNRERAREEGAGIPEDMAAGMAAGMSSVDSAASSLADQITNSLNANLKRLPEMAEAMGTDISEGLATGLETGEPTLNAAGQGLGESVGTGVSNATPAVNTAGQNLADTAVTSITNGLSTEAPAAFDFATELGELVGNRLSGGVATGGDPAAVTSLITRFMDSIRSNIGTVSPQIQESGKAMGNAFATGVDQANATPQGKGLIDEVTTGINQGLGSTSGGATEAGKAVGESMATGIEAACAPVNNSAADLTDSCVPDGIDSGLKTATNTASDAGQDVSNSLMDGLNITKKDVRENFGKAGNEFTSSMATGIAAKVQDAINSSKSVATQAGQVDGTAQGKNVGSSIGQGIAQGIIQQSEAVKEAARQVVRDAESAAKDEAGAKSPSRLFAELGRDLDMGIAKGMMDNVGYIIDASGHLIDAAHGALSGTAIISAGREFSRSMDSYTQRIEDVVAWAERAVNVDTIPKAARVSERRTATAPRQGGSPAQGDSVTVTVNGLNVDAESPEGRATLDFVTALRQMQGQYRK